MSGNSCHFRGCANPRAKWCTSWTTLRTVVTLRYLYFRGKMIVLEDACRGFHLLARGGVWTKHTIWYMRAQRSFTWMESADLHQRRFHHAYVCRPQTNCMLWKSVDVCWRECLHKFTALFSTTLGDPTTRWLGCFGKVVLNRSDPCKPYKDLASNDV